MNIVFEHLADGKLPLQDKDYDVTALILGEGGENILAVSRPARIIVPMTDVTFPPKDPAHPEATKFYLAWQSLGGWIGERAAALQDAATNSLADKGVTHDLITVFVRDVTWDAGTLKASLGLSLLPSIQLEDGP